MISNEMILNEIILNEMISNEMILNEIILNEMISNLFQKHPRKLIFFKFRNNFIIYVDNCIQECLINNVHNVLNN